MLTIHLQRLALTTHAGRWRVSHEGGLDEACGVMGHPWANWGFHRKRIPNSSLAGFLMETVTRPASSNEFQSPGCCAPGLSQPLAVQSISIFSVGREEVGLLVSVLNIWRRLVLILFAFNFPWGRNHRSRGSWAELPRERGDTGKVKLFLGSSRCLFLGFCSNSVLWLLYLTPGLPQKYSHLQVLDKNSICGGITVKNSHSTTLLTSLKKKSDYKKFRTPRCIYITGIMAMALQFSTVKRTLIFVPSHF